MYPRHFKAVFNRAFAYDKLNNYKLAVRDYTRAIELQPENAYAYYNRGIAHDRQGNFRGAIGDYTKALECSGIQYNTIVVQYYSTIQYNTIQYT